MVASTKEGNWAHVNGVYIVNDYLERVNRFRYFVEQLQEGETYFWALFPLMKSEELSKVARRKSRKLFDLCYYMHVKRGVGYGRIN